MILLRFVRRRPDNLQKPGKFAEVRFQFGPKFILIVSDDDDMRPVAANHPPGAGFRITQNRLVDMRLARQVFDAIPFMHIGRVPLEVVNGFVGRDDGDEVVAVTLRFGK